jgi:hypothetical protein
MIVMTFALCHFFAWAGVAQTIRPFGFSVGTFPLS